MGPDPVAELTPLLAHRLRPGDWELRVRSLSAGLDDRAVQALLERCGDGAETAAVRVAAVELLRGVATRGAHVEPADAALGAVRLLAYAAEPRAVRACAARSLAFFGSASDRLGLAERLACEADPAERQAIGWALGASRAEDVVSSLLAQLDGPRCEEVLRVLAALGPGVWTARSRALAAAAVEAEQGEFGNGPDVRRVAALVAIGGSAGRSALVGVLRAEHEPSARVAAAALVAAGEPESLRALGELHADASLPVRRRFLAAEALARAGPALDAAARRRLAEELADALRGHPDPALRRRAAWALAELDEPQARAALAEAAREDRDPSVRTAAGAALERRSA